MTLHLSDTFTLPDEAAVQKFAILAMSGAGKSNTAVVMAEQMHAAGLPWVAIDPKGDWWGVRSSRDGDGPGLPVPVLGGLHGDVPLEPTAGKVVANLIAERRLTCVLDVSEFDSKAAQSRFLTDLATTLLKRNTQPLHLFLEEADEYLPQRFSSRGGDATAACVGAWQRVVKRGRFRGLGVTLISQRSAALNKDALNQVDTLIAMRVTAPTDRKAILGWVEQFDIGRDVVDSLPELNNGEAWIWSPAWLRILERVQFARRTTFDSGATPLLIGEAAQHPATLADVDLDALKDEMAATIERAAADDPKLLRARIAELEHELRQRPEPQVIVHDVEIPTPYIPPELADLTHRLAVVLVDLEEPVGALSEISEQIDHVINDGAAKAAAWDAAHAAPTPSTSRNTTPTSPKKRPTSPSSAPHVAPTPDVQLGGGERKVLAVLAQYPDGRTKSELAFLAGYSAKASTIGVILSNLRRAGLIEPGNQPVRATAAGLTAAGGVQDLPTGAALLEHWFSHSRVGEGERKVLQALIDAYPAEMSKDDLCEATGYSPIASTVGVILSKLRKLGLVEKNRRRVEGAFMESISR